MLGGELQRVDDAQHLVEVAAGRHRIDEDELDLLVRADDEDVAHGLVLRGGARRRIAVDVRRQHAVELGDVELAVTDQRVVRGRTGDRLDVLGPLLVVADGVDGEPDDLRVALVELGLDRRHVAELGRADRREVARVREEHAPRVAEPVMKRDASFGRVSLEIRGGFADRQSHLHPPMLNTGKSGWYSR